LGGAHALTNYSKEIGDGFDDAPIRAAIAQICGQIPLGPGHWVVDDVQKEDWGPLLMAERADAARLFPKEEPRATPKFRLTSMNKIRLRKLRRPRKRVKLSDAHNKSEVIDLTLDEEDEPSTAVDSLETELANIKSEPADSALEDILVPGPSTTKTDPVEVSTPTSELPRPSSSSAYPSPPASSPPVPSGIKPDPEPGPLPEAFGNFGACVDDASLSDLLGVLTVPELKNLAQEYKIRASGRVRYGNRGSPHRDN
jgi:hypothetical protein